MIRIVCLLIGYVFGLFQTAYIYGKLHGIDIRNHGSGNAGTTNTLRVLGAKAGLIVFFGDLLKCFLAVFLVGFFLKDDYPDMIYLLKLYAAAGAILGHDFPFYLKFRGGKGIASTAGMMLGFHPIMIPVEIICFFGVFITTHYVSLGSLVLYVGFMVTLVILGQTGIIAMPVPVRIEMYILALLLMILAFVRHKDNIKRLINGCERKTYLFKKNTENIEQNIKEGDKK